MASEKFNRSTTVAADAATTWTALTDVDRLAGWVGILHDVKEIERLDTYTAVLEDRVGPFKLRADLSVDVTVPDIAQLVPELVDDLADAVDGRLCNAVAAVDDFGNGRDRHPGPAGHVGHLHALHWVHDRIIGPPDTRFVNVIDTD